MTRIFTSEAVTVGHPDKICDQIADAILVDCLLKDPDSHVACEVCCTTGTVVLMGEITTTASVDYKQIARDVLYNIGYVDSEYGICYKDCSIIDLIDKQSPEINKAVNQQDDKSKSYDLQGAGDQGIIFGYACRETKELMPLSHMLAHDLASRLYMVRVLEILPYIRPDGKTQVSIAYNDEGLIDQIDHIDTILISTQHDPDIPMNNLKKDLIDVVIDPVLKSRNLTTSGTKIIINPSGSFTIGGPHGDTGLTGRKLAVDTYGGHAKFGGGAMCGKDPSKVDRSAAYMARYIAKHIVEARYAYACEVQISYGIGIAKPISVWVDTKGTGILPDIIITEIVNKVFDMRPAAITDTLHLKEFNYNAISGSCQFGNQSCPWEVISDSILDELHRYEKYYLN